MTSQRVEDAHREQLEKLLADSGLECLRSPLISSESSISSGSTLEPGRAEEEEEIPTEVVLEEEQKSPPVEQSPEELPEIFPTPSLRHLLPDKVRAIEKQNRIHVLPEEFKFNIDPLAIPKIAYTAQQKYIEVLADLVGCKKYKSSLAEFWFLDTLAKLLLRAQEDDLDRPTQAILIYWFCEWMKEMQHFDAADRCRMLKRFQDNMLAAAKILAAEDRLPTPAEVGVFYNAQEDAEARETANSSINRLKHVVKFEGAIYECCLRDLTKIIHYIFDLFSTDFQYNLVRSVFTFTPEYTLIDAPYQILNPKRIYAPMKTKAKKAEKSPKSSQKDKGVKKKPQAETAEFLALMEMKAKEEKLIEEQEERDKEEWHRRSHILPLTFAADEEFFNKYWPPPPPEPEPEVVVDTKTKSKAKSKK